MNIGIRKNNTSGFKGVIFKKKINKWKAQITFQGKYKSLGCFFCIVKAARAYDKAAIELFGEFARLNFPVI